MPQSLLRSPKGLLKNLVVRRRALESPKKDEFRWIFWSFLWKVGFEGFSMDFHQEKGQNEEERDG